MKAHLYTNITHEFRTPLTLILGEAEQLKKQVSDSQKTTLDAIRRNGRQLLNLINQMLDLAKLEAGNLPLHLHQSDVIIFLKYLLESFRSLAEAKKIRLHFQAPAESFFMDFDLAWKKPSTFCQTSSSAT